MKRNGWATAQRILNSLEEEFEPRYENYKKYNLHTIIREFIERLGGDFDLALELIMPI